jgi:predicted metalloprotease with PDZ domain
VLSRRAGAIDDDEYLKRINDRASGYYTNPYRSATNAEAAQKFWLDSRAQRVPYGRGFMYLARVDAQVRAASAGRRSLDDLVLEVLRRQRKGETVGLEEWVQLVTREIGPVAKDEFDAMVAGGTIVPPAASLAPCLRPEARRERPLELGFDEFVTGKVTNLVAGSAAALAGVQEGDEIVEMIPASVLQQDEAREMVMTIRRGGGTRVVHYLPRGRAVDSWRWVKTATPLESCHY